MMRLSRPSRRSKHELVEHVEADKLQPKEAKGDMLLKAVVFDLDGTLVTAEIDFPAMRRSIRDLFVSHGFPPETLPTTGTQDLLRSASSYAEKQGRPPIEIRTLRDQAYAIAEKFEWEGARKAQLVPGALEALTELKRRRVRVGVLTNGNRGSTDYLLRKFQLRELVDVVVSRDEAPQMKPATDGLELILRQLKVKRNATVLVGDSTIDLATARKLSVEFIARLSGVGAPEQLRAEGAVVLISTLVELIPYLDTRKLLPRPHPNDRKKP
jgi:HAD superfamily hydrolase (TIGR01549 family)